jgi:5-methylcytosine-specific restriction endonuclease McrA
MPWMQRIKPRSKPRPGRLKGKAIGSLREQCWERDKGICGGGRSYRGKPLGCGLPVDPNNWHMAHLKGKRMGGDNLNNVVVCHMVCHLVGIHNPKSVPRKV